MNTTLETIKTRRSVRKYKPDMLPREIIDQIIEAGLYAASGMNTQNTVIVAITDKATRDRLSRDNAAVMGSDRDPFYGAPVVLVVLAEKGRGTYIHDGALVMGNLMLAAHALGVGSCWIHRARETFDQPEWKEWLASLGLEGEYEGIGNCILGYTDGDEPAAPARREGRVFRAE
ncbi:MAG: nitroreductase [Clostridia bacterium]|nr:nitroreductase [Clostridia bacterium]